MLQTTYAQLPSRKLNKVSCYVLSFCISKHIDCWIHLVLNSVPNILSWTSIKWTYIECIKLEREGCHETKILVRLYTSRFLLWFLLSWNKTDVLSSLVKNAYFDWPEHTIMSNLFNHEILYHTNQLFNSYFISLI